MTFQKSACLVDRVDHGLLDFRGGQVKGQKIPPIVDEVAVEEAVDDIDDSNQDERVGVETYEVEEIVPLVESQPSSERPVESRHSLGLSVVIVLLQSKNAF